ncbi:hypothetical protein Nepgr_005933 [Nepenthes gracilis]|uniref:RING-type E3 ubiquitin transferase n=1 Tax=Nepenthes gracilis TaxID=150966 RepID=A0AAD3XGV1_NEPGR|nr:hypothetical protein Nepgr_005933 [Nepenthes gracilis]
MTTVAVAVSSGGSDRGNGSKRAVRWAAENLLSHSHRLTLVHVMPPVAHILTPSGNRVSIKQLDASTVRIYMKDVRVKVEEIFSQYKRLCKTAEVETVVLEDLSPATSLLRYISKSRVRIVVLGSHSSNFFWRKLKGPGITSTVLECSPDFCDVFVVSKSRVTTKQAIPMIPTEAICSNKQTCRCSSSSLGCRSCRHTRMLSVPEVQHSNSSADSELNAWILNPCSSVASPNSEQIEVKQLQLELRTTLALYSQACEDLVHTQNKVQQLSSSCIQETEKINAAIEREETLRRIAVEEKEKHLEAVKEAETAKSLLAKISCERQRAELNALKESSEKQKIFDALITADRGYRRYTVDEIKAATDSFSESKVIGKGSYGKVYKGNLDHAVVAIKVLQRDASDKKEQFLQEVEILSQLHHPNIILLLGACPEICCLVYEYMENGSLEDVIFHQNDKPPLPWFARFKIAFEIACGLAFLHCSKPEPIVHRDLKPGNILLGRNYISKISDVGLAKILSDIVPDGITHFQISIVAGTLCYMDPEYQRTGTVRPKSDLYSFGIILLQLLTGLHPSGLLLVMEKVVESGSLSNKLDNSISDWPVTEAEDLARVALDCCELRCRDRPDLETEVLPVLKRLADAADASMKVQRNSVLHQTITSAQSSKETMKDQKTRCTTSKKG